MLKTCVNPLKNKKKKGLEIFPFKMQALTEIYKMPISYFRLFMVIWEPTSVL